jgi:prolyl-tRNA editing enzyme YbaK/EbsC (Cys-tRNA(Pro) deacylase)
VPPFGFPRTLRIFIDPDLLEFDEVWAAAGTWNDNFGTKPNENVRAIAGVISDPRWTRVETSQDCANFNPSIACA